MELGIYKQVANLINKLQQILLFTLIVAVLPYSAVADIVEFNFHWEAPADGALIDHYNIYIAVDSNPFEMITTSYDTSYTLLADYDISYQVRVSGVSEYDIEGPLSSSSDSIMLPSPRPEYGVEIPEAVGLKPNYPNPFNPETTISYGIPDGLIEARTALEIYSIRGERLRIFNVETTPGWHTVSWNGRDSSGIMQPSGRYFVRYACGETIKTWSMTMVK
jgi:hypothetical protein